MKAKILIPSLAAALLLCGCQQLQNQANQVRTDTLNALSNASEQVISTKNSIVDTKNKIDTKIKQAEDIKSAIDKFNTN